MPKVNWWQTPKGKRKNRERSKAYRKANRLKANAAEKVRRDENKSEINAERRERAWRMKEMEHRLSARRTMEYIAAGMTILSGYSFRFPEFIFVHAGERRLEKYGV